MVWAEVWAKVWVRVLVDIEPLVAEPLHHLEAHHRQALVLVVQPLFKQEEEV